MTPAKLPLPSMLGRYRLTKQLGVGGMGTVYLAEDSELHRQVAVKVPHFTQDDGSEIVERFLREARVAARIEHPHLCAVHDVGRHNKTPFLVMPFIEGCPLSQLVNRERPWPPDKAAALVRKLAQALQVLHDHGIVHRDLKPANVMMRANGEPIIMDFGLARSHTGTSQQLTREGALVGTPAYMAPEQVKGEGKAIGPATDIYALGVVLYELLTGTVPFEGPVHAVLAQVLAGTLETPSARRPGLGVSLDAICLKALARKPGGRYASMQKFAAALAAPAMTACGPTAAPVPAKRNSGPISLSCPSCGKRLRVAATAAGKRVRCPVCEMPVSVPPRPKDQEDFTEPARRSRRRPWLAASAGGLLVLTIGMLISSLIGSKGQGDASGPSTVTAGPAGPANGAEHRPPKEPVPPGDERPEIPEKAARLDKSAPQGDRKSGAADKPAALEKGEWEVTLRQARLQHDYTEPGEEMAVNPGGADRRVAVVGIEFEALSPIPGSLQERLAPGRDALSTEEMDYLADTNVPALVKSLGRDTASEVLAKPARLFLSNKAELLLSDGARLGPAWTSAPPGLLTFTPRGSTRSYGFASKSAVGQGDPTALRFIRRPDLTAALVQPRRKFTLDLVYIVPATTERATFRFYDCRPVAVSLAK